MRNTFRSFLLVLLSLMLLSSCALAEAPQPDAQKKQGKIELTFWHNFGASYEAPAMEKMVETYNNSQDKVHITAEYVGDVSEKLQAAIIGGNAPDVALFSGNAVKQWANEGMFMDLTDLCQQAGITGDGYYENCWEEATYNGRVYAIPFNTDCRALFYNTDMFEAAGLDVNNPPTTIAQLDEYAEKLTIRDDSGRYVQLGFIPWTGHGGILTWGFAFGGSLYDKETGLVTADDPAFVEALTWEKTYADKYDIEAVDSFTLTTQGVISSFTSLKQAMIVGGSWEIAQYEEITGLHYKVCAIPSPDGEHFYTWAGGYDFVIPYNKTANAEYVIDFMKFCSTGEGALIFCEDGGWFCTNRELNEQLSWVQKDERYQVFVDALDTARCRPPVSQGQYFLEQLTTAEERVIHADEDPAAMLKKASDRVNKRLKH